MPNSAQKDSTLFGWFGIAKLATRCGPDARRESDPSDPYMHVALHCPYARARACAFSAFYHIR